MFECRRARSWSDGYNNEDDVAVWEKNVAKRAELLYVCEQNYNN
jgi:hypothetical protein